MIERFWKSPEHFASADDDAAVCAIINDRGSERETLSKVFYFFKPLIPRRLQIGLRRRKARQTRRSFPPGIEDMMRRPVLKYVRASGSDFPFIWFWPGAYDMAFLVTHDVESRDGCKQVLRLAEIDEKHGFRAAFNFVCRKYPIDNGIIRELKARGFEIGVHGVKHDGRLFASQRIFRERLEVMKSCARSWGAAGFRSPSLQRDTSLMQALPFEWDSSFPDWDPYGPQPGGCRTVFPFFLSARTLELPVTMIQDHTLFEILEESGDAAWKEKTSYISLLGGLATIIVHPDYIFKGERLKVYEGFLEHMRHHDKLWRAKPCEVSQWWRQRDQSALDIDGGVPAVKGPAAGRGSVAYWSRISEKWEQALVS